MANVGAGWSLSGGKRRTVRKVNGKRKNKTNKRRQSRRNGANTPMRQRRRSSRR